MRKILFGVSLAFVVLALSQIVCADEFVVMSNGMTCWRNSDGMLWGCSGGSSTGDPSGFNDTENGDRYNYTGDKYGGAVGPNGWVNTPPRNDDNWNGSGTRHNNGDNW